VCAAALLCGLGLAGGGCAPSLPAATPADAVRANVELADLQRGRTLVVSKCGGCHRPPLPAEHGGDAWPSKLDEMSARSNLDVNQRHLIEAYLVTMATREPSPR
jgi:hypothetical protein